jgi:hypothetical protein
MLSGWLLLFKDVPGVACTGPVSWSLCCTERRDMITDLGLPEGMLVTCGVGMVTPID